MPCGGSSLNEVVNGPDPDIYPIDVSFQALRDSVEFQYLNELPTSFALSDMDVDRLRRTAGTIILQSPDFQRLLRDAGAKPVDRNAGG